jgi:hypothetical protein
MAFYFRIARSISKPSSIAKPPRTVREMKRIAAPTMRPSSLESLADALGVSVKDLLGGMTMDRRRVLIALVVPTVAGLLVAFWPRCPRPCLNTFKLVRVGMTRDEVMRTVGAAPGDYSDGNVVRMPVSYAVLLFSDRWLANDATMYVDFDDDGQAGYVVVQEEIRLPERTFWERFQGRLGI